jgi:hypothetical protein
VSVDVHVGLHDGDENETVIPVGTPLVPNVTACVAPVSSVAVIGFVTDPPAVTVFAPPLAREKVNNWVTVNENVVVCVSVPAVPVTVIVLVPTGVVVAGVSARTVEQVGLQDVTENELVVPVGNPETENVTVCVVPDVSVAVTVYVTVEPCAVVFAPPFVRVKVNEAFTVSENVVVCVSVPAVPVTVIVAVPVVAVVDAVSVNVDEHVGLHDAAENDAVTPVGNPEAENVTA